MLFQSRQFSVPKDYPTPQFYEDACAVNGDAGRVAIADGVSSAVFSGSWAQILTQSVITAPPNVHDAVEFAAWLVDRRKEWAAGINVSKLEYHLLMKLRQVGGGFSTLAWIEVRRDDPADGTDTEYRVHGQGVGDSCIFHVRDGQLLAKWPMQDSAEFKEDPISIGSVNFQCDAALKFQEFDWCCRAGDLLVLATDAVSEWAYLMQEAGETVNWDDLSRLPDSQMAQYLTDLRESNWLKRDDSTIVFVGLGRTEPFVSPVEEAGEEVGEQEQDETAEATAPVAEPVAEAVEVELEAVSAGLETASPTAAIVPENGPENAPVAAVIAPGSQTEAPEPGRPFEPAVPPEPAPGTMPTNESYCTFLH